MTNFCNLCIDDFVFCFIKMEKGDQGKEDSRDRISELTDEILFLILSFLTLKEVANICFLSRRLKILWPHIVALNFDASNTLGELRRNGRLRKKKRTWYINWVNHVLESHKGSTLNEFRVCFDLDWTCRHDIDRWFCFAISKRVRKLELDFEEVAEETWPPGLRSYSLTKSCFNYIRTPQGLSCIGLLDSLCLRFVKVSGEVLEHFLLHCPLLEKLVVEWSKNLVTLNVASSSPLRLRYLEIRSCLALQNLEISAPNLQSFLYYGQKVELHIENAPLLTDVLIGGNLDDEPAFAFCPLSGYLCQLKTLTLEMSAYNMTFPNFPELTNLRHLAVSAYGGYDDDLLVLTSLIDASPSLNKLSLELNIWRSSTYNHAHNTSNVTGKPIPSLKVVEVIGFRGFKIDVDFLAYLLEHGKVMEKITINCCHPSWAGQILEFETIKERERARKHALQLKSKSPSTTEFVII
ncbi:hypothetical protein Goshw_014965 [Gossypium schwendimanii]|uniref:FBD domain-containing protein n=1 Tax=Gossypium schwendimanii TaxID=34291 RepID=A0A7J9LA42_GOSSC|nr:hypothetical protein [Gossypium schwendimanii]